MFTPLVVETQQVVLVAVGAAVLWVKMGWSGTASIVGPTVNKFIPLSWPRSRLIVEFVLFVVIGVVIGVVFTEPANGKQAIAAGLGWTALLAAEKKTSVRKATNGEAR